VSLGQTRVAQVAFRVCTFKEIDASPAFNATNLRLISENLYVMTNLQFKGSWNEVKGKVKQKYGQLTDDDLAFAEGKDDELLGRLQKKLGKSKEELQREIESV